MNKSPSEDRAALARVESPFRLRELVPMYRPCNPFGKKSELLIANHTEVFLRLISEFDRGVGKDTAGPIGSAKTLQLSLQKTLIV